MIEKLLLPKKKFEEVDVNALSLVVGDLDYIKAVCKYLKENKALDKAQAENVDKLVALVDGKLKEIKSLFEAGSAKAVVNEKGAVTVQRTAEGARKAEQKKAKFQEKVKELESKPMKGKQKHEKVAADKEARIAAAKQQLKEAVKLQKAEVAKKYAADAKVLREEWKKPQLSREEELEKLGFGKPDIKKIGQELNAFVESVRKEVDLTGALGKWFGASSAENKKLKQLLAQDFAALKDNEVIKSGREVVELIGKAFAQKGKAFADIPDAIKRGRQADTSRP